jgi:uncharacterized membrane protein
MNKIPSGWDYNPSSWPQRIPIVVLAIIGFLVASYLALFQMKMLPEVWDPFFGGGSRKILSSYISHLLPLPDAALGAAVYLLDAVAGLIGGSSRWRTMPWMVVIFGVAVGPLGVISVLLVIFQPVLFAAWCTLCLATALISVLMIGPAMDEVLASLQFLKGAKARGESTWTVFWKGGAA